MMKERIVHCFNKSAHTYNSASRVQNAVANALAKRIPSVIGKNILEIGCGTGFFSQFLLSTFPHATLLLTDVAPEMVSSCKNRFSVFPQIQFACMDGEALSLTRSYDLIASNMTLHWFTQLETSFENIMASLAPGGQFIFSMLGERSLVEWRNLCEQYHYPIPTPSFPSHQWLKKQFPEMRIDIENISYPYPSLHDFLGTLKSIGATATPEPYIPLTAGKLRPLLRDSNKTIHITYEIIYGHYIKS